MTFKTKLKKKLRPVVDDGLNIVLISLLTGVFAGVVVTFYNILAVMGEDVSVGLYTLVLNNPAFVPLLFVALAAGAVVIGTLVKLVPMIRGSGIPQIEGAARGVVPFRWYVTMCTMFAASLACMFLGLAAGAEGPSLEIGGCAGGAVGVTLKRNQMAKRLQIAGGASAGLAVAFNAPVTGLVFAMEEAFRSFSPRVFISAAISVVSALFVRNAIRPALGLEVGFAFNNFVFGEFDLLSCLWVIPASVIAALAGVLFYKAVFAVKRLFGRITFFKGTGKFIIPFCLAGAFGLITVFAIGGGHSFIQALATGGTGEITISGVFGLSVILSLLVILIIRFASTVVNMGCGVPCGVFIPMLSIGAGIGAIVSLLFCRMGMSGSFVDYLVIICMSVFFTTVVKAPITGIVMVFELTGQFTNFLPALLGIAIGYLTGILFRTEPIYEKCLNMYIEEEKLYEHVVKERVAVVIQSGSRADGAKVRSVIWPTNGLVVEIITESGKKLVPDGETIMRAGETLTFECETSSREELFDYLYTIVGKPDVLSSEDKPDVLSSEDKPDGKR